MITRIVVFWCVYSTLLRVPFLDFVTRDGRGVLLVVEPSKIIFPIILYPKGGYHSIPNKILLRSFCRVLVKLRVSS